ncbi:hypothetical protein [Clostridium manihotivorum]|uniref:Uncharacterized protein n=1 Tax=Clostridium manihotivorum TaxID=2320868 RepID=A0A3R5V6S1_9CLOT|nr:hypothetical protein [Clostridium manihotivorum]QAA31473.1 hypothetical protein C1I91_07395 [Clostridium manihotivorum]
MNWKRGIVTFDDGSSYDSEFLVNEEGQIYNVKVFKNGEAIKEVEAEEFAEKLGKSVEDIYPYKASFGENIYK